MNVREKLIELLAEDYPCDHEDCLKCPFCDDEVACLSRLKANLADNLIAHGVTVQEWISVEDRLPEYDQAVLCYKSDRGVRFGKVLAATYADGVQAFMDCERKYAFGATHWMPLPEPPAADMRGGK